MPLSPPEDEAQLMQRARSLEARSIDEVAELLAIRRPKDLGRAKGFVGKLIEEALGASAGNRSEPDFPALGIELKTLPIASGGRVKESTFVSTAALPEAADLEWEESRVRKKLKRVLFVLVEAAGSRPPGERLFGSALLWSPSVKEELALRHDWEQLSGLIGAGLVDTIDATMGQHLQLRPKGANSAARTQAYDAEGAPMLHQPRAYYLRARFTASVLQASGLLIR